MSAPASPWPAPPLAVAVEIADTGTRLAALVGDAPGGRHLQERRASPLSAEDAHVVLADFARQALHDAGLLDGPEWRGVPAAITLGVALSGQVNTATGVVHVAHGLPDWAGLPLGERLTELVACATIESAINAAAVAECALGAASGSESALYITIGRQITSAFAIDGEVVRGAHDKAGEIGHRRVAASGPRCACGAEGHLDPLASAQAIVRTMIGRASDSDESLEAILRITQRRAEALTAAQVVRLADEGDPLATSVIGAAVEGLAAALANLTAVLDPAIIVLDGPFAGQWDTFVGRIHERTRAWAPGFAATVVPSRLGSRAVLEGRDYWRHGVRGSHEAPASASHKTSGIIHETAAATDRCSERDDVAAERSHSGIRLLNRYHIDEQLARGTLCAVYRGRDTVLHRSVVVKVIPPELVGVYREALHLTAAFTHPVVVATYDAVAERDALYLVQEHVQARPLAAYARDGIPSERAVDLAAQIARALAYAHAHDIVHGDLTPAAILIDRQATVRINNFGLPPDTLYFAKQTQSVRDAYVAAETEIIDLDAPARPAIRASAPHTMPRASDDVCAVGLLLWQVLTEQSRASDPTGQGAGRQFRRDVPPLLRDLVWRCALEESSSGDCGR